MNMRIKRSHLTVLDTEPFNEVQRKVFSSFVRKHFSRRQPPIRILEAGCGKKWNFDLKGIDCVLTGLDISQEALDVRKTKQQDLDEAIVGDLRTVELADAQYDVIYCAYVLEHIDGAEHVMDKFFRWLTPGGLLVLVIPDGATVLGLLTKITPYWFHVLVYRYILGSQRAGEAGHGPFPTVYDRVVSREGVRRYASTHGHRVHIEYACTPDLNRVFGIASAFLAFIFKIGEITSIGRFASGHSALLFVIEKQ
jgi:SAM-dependent methyltransferase